VSPDTLIASRTFSPITRTDIVKYQGASGDFNAIHHDQGFAERAGYKTVLSVGMLAAGYLTTLLAETVGPANLRSVRFRFDELCWPGDVLECTISLLSTDPDAGTAELLLAATKEGDKTAVSGTAVIDLHGLTPKEDA
jgi:acyl dehydratase